MKSEKVKKILQLERSEIPRAKRFGNCITITGLSFFPVVSRLLRKMLFVGVCQLFPYGLSLERKKLASKTGNSYSTASLCFV